MEGKLATTVESAYEIMMLQKSSCTFCAIFTALSIKTPLLNTWCFHLPLASMASVILYKAAIVNKFQNGCTRHTCLEEYNAAKRKVNFRKWSGEAAPHQNVPAEQRLAASW